MKSFELFDTESGNLVGSYRSIGDAYQTIRNGLNDYGRNEVSTLALFYVDTDSQELLIAGNTLILAAEDDLPVVRTFA